MLLDEFSAAGDKLDWFPVGLRGEEERFELWLYWYAVHGYGAALPERLWEQAAFRVRYGTPVLPPRRIERTPDTDAIVRRAYEWKRDDTIEVDLPAVGRVTLAAAKLIGGTLTMQFLSGFRSYIGAAIFILTGIAAICTALAGVLGFINSGDIGSLTSLEWWGAILAGAASIGQGFKTIGQAGKSDKEMAVQIAVAEGKTELAKSVLAGDVVPKEVAGR